MNATQELRDEHEGIKVALLTLGRMSSNLDSGQAVDVDDLEAVVDFLRTFADRCHHGKEEDLLFPALERAGIPKEGGPIGVMLTEHAHGREQIRAMADAIPRLREGDLDARRDFASAAREYVRLLSDHIEKENNVLFPMADRHIPQEEQAELSEGFERIEQERIGPGVHERYHELLDRLSNKYLRAA